MIALVLSSALAAGPSDVDPVEQALASELKRNVAELTLPGAPPIYHLRYEAVILTQTDVRASWGELMHEEHDPYHALGLQLRVGDPMFDNSGFGGWQNGFGMTWLPRTLTSESVQQDAWRLTDRSYKQAIEQYARKQAQFTPPDDYPGDYLLTGPVVHDGGDGGGDPSGLPATAKAISAALALDPSIDIGDVYIGQESGHRLILDTEGSRVVEPMEECTMRAVVTTRAVDGQLLTDQRLWTVRRPEQLPALDVLVADAKAMAEHLLAVAKAPLLDDEYVGPVLFEDGAAIDLFRWLLVPQLEGTPPDVPFDSWFGELGGSGGNVRVGRRVLPSGWSVTDDPSARPDHPASFASDNEGTPAQSVSLVTDGIVRTLLMSRVPRPELSGSNGHARGSLGQRDMGKAAIVEIAPAKQSKPAAVRKAALKAAAAYGRDWYVTVRRLQDPAIRGLAGDTSGYGDEVGSSIPQPVSIVKVFADGHEEELRGAAFSGVHRWVLRDIIAAGKTVGGSFMAVPDDGSPVGLGATGGLATYLSTPEVLIGEMEIVPTPGDPRDLPVILPPKMER